MPNNLLCVTSLCTHYIQKKRTIRAVENVSFEVARGETLAIVGESGCGKSTLALSLFRLVPPPGRIVSGSIRFNGRDLCTLKEREMAKIRGREIGLILQDSLSALDPVMRVGVQIAEVRRYHFGESRKTARQRALEMMERVRLPRVEQIFRAYPHELSGGQRQRISIAISLACRPKLLVADEPTSALDVSIQAQILSLLKELQREMQLALLLITHDLAVVAQTADHVAVMRGGVILEQDTTRRIFQSPAHAYTKALLRAVPRIEFALRDAPES